MKIEYKDADGRVLELEVSDAVGRFCIFSAEREAVEDSEVERLLSCLDARQRELVQKCMIEGWTYAEIAAREGKDESAVRHAVKRALKKIK